MKTDTWHYPRIELAKQVLGMFETGLSSALVFFAPRRMGKTEFLRKDVTPLAIKQGWQVFYFSFLDAETAPAAEFTKALASFIKKNNFATKASSILKKISKISGEAAGIKAGLELQREKKNKTLKEIMDYLASKGKILLLLDEIQVLAKNPANATFIATLRTALDIHKDNIKVIFTGSSQEGLRRMFSQAKAPFFHFGQNLPFPELERGFTDHLAQAFTTITGRKIDTDMLWSIFEKMQRIPQLLRALVERLTLQPNLKLQEAYTQIFAEVFDNRAFADTWENCSALERQLLQEMSLGTNNFFSNEIRLRLAKKIGIPELSIPSLQSVLRTLQRKGLIGRLPDRGGYYIDDPNFKSWLLQNDT